MRILGIDYGRKKIGIAVTDEKGKFAFPLVVLENNKKIFTEIKNLAEEKKVKKIILGLPLNLSGGATLDTKPAQNFKLKLEKITGLPVIFEKEFFTTKEAERIQGKHRKIDASAAALILLSFTQKLRRVNPLLKNNYEK